MQKNEIWLDVVMAWFGSGLRPVVAALAILIALTSYLSGFSTVPDAGPGLLMWERDAIVAGQWWRLLTAHLIHLSELHLLLNLLGLFLVTELLCGQMTTAEFLSLLVASAIGVSLLLLLQPQLRWYAGFSGVLHGVWSGSASLKWLREKKRLDLIALLALVVKLACASPAIAGLPVVAEAHLYGALSGLLWLGLMQACQRNAVFD